MNVQIETRGCPDVFLDTATNKFMCMAIVVMADKDGRPTEYPIVLHGGI